MWLYNKFWINAEEQKGEYLHKVSSGNDTIQSIKLLLHLPVSIYTVIYTYVQ